MRMKACLVLLLGSLAYYSQICYELYFRFFLANGTQHITAVLSFAIWFAFWRCTVYCWVFL